MRKKLITILLFSLSLIPLLWFPGKSIVLGYDAVFPLNPLPFLTDRLSSWTQAQGFGMDQSGIQGSLIIHFIDSIPLLLGFSAQTAQKIVFSFWFFMLLFSAYFLIYRLEKAKIVDAPYLKYIFPVLYAFNFYVLQAWWIIERTKFSLMVATPLILSVILPFVMSKFSLPRIFKNALICAFILTIFNGGGWAGLPLYGGLLVSIFCVYIFFTAVFLSKKDKKSFLYLTLFLFLFGLFYLVINSYTLLPFLSTTLHQYSSQVDSVGGVSGVIGWAEYISESASFSNLFRLQGIPDWYNNIHHPYALIYLKNPILIFVSFLFPVLIFSSLLKIKKSNKIFTIFILMSFLISTFFTAGTHPPLGGLFELLITYVPGFLIFRSPIFKFGYSYWLFSGLLIGLPVSYLIEQFVSRGKNLKFIKFLSFLLPAIFIAAIVIYHFPYFTGNFFSADKTHFSSRVEIPKYVSDFYSWWQVNGKEDRVLLLPKLNGNWLFEQYNWNYLSPFPVLDDFGARGIVENTDTLSSPEMDLLSSLYKSMNDGDYNKAEKITSMLGIKYILLRKDFNYNFPDQETDSPKELENKLLADSHLEKIKDFGKWSLYSYKTKKPFIFAKGNAVLSVNPSDPAILDNNPLFLQSEGPNSKNISDILIYPSCLSCIAEKKKIDVTFPKPTIRLDSFLYNFVELKRRLFEKKYEKIDDRIFQTLGDTIYMTGQIGQLLAYESDESYIYSAATNLEKSLDSLTNEYSEVINKSPNPYSMIITVQEYLDAERDYINEVRLSTSQQSELVNLEGVLYKLGNVYDLYSSFYSKKEINLNKIYSFNISSPGYYVLSIQKESLANAQEENLKVSIDGKEINQESENADSLIFGKYNLTKGDHRITMNLVQSGNILDKPIKENIAGNSCFSSFANSFSPDKVYDLNFSSENNFDKNFFFFIDNGKNFSPNIINFFPLSGNEIKNYRYIIANGNISLPVDSEKIRISFCSPNLTEDLYQKNVTNLSLINLSAPVVELHKNENIMQNESPSISFVKINETSYKVSVVNAKSPFYLVFAERFSLGWKANIGEHLIGNNYDNVWYINKMGDYQINIYYNPQKYFAIGVIISLISLAISLILLLKFKND